MILWAPPTLYRQIGEDSGSTAGITTGLQIQGGGGGGQDIAMRSWGFV